MKFFDGKSANENKANKTTKNPVERLHLDLEDKIKSSTTASQTRASSAAFKMESIASDSSKHFNNQTNAISVEFALRLFASHWNNIPYDHHKYSDPSYQETELTPSSLLNLSHELQLVTNIEKRKIRNIEQSQLPMLMVMEDQKCIILTKRIDKDQFEISDGVHRDQLDLKSLESISGGELVSLIPKTDAANPDAQEGKQQSNYHLIKAVTQELFTNQRLLFGQLMVSAIISNIMVIALPLFIMSIYDRIVPHLAYETLWVLAIGVLIALAIDLGMKLMRQNLVDAISLSTSVKLQAELYRHLSRLKFKDVPKNAGALANSTHEFDNIATLVPQILVSAMIDLPFFVLILFLLYHLGNAVILAPVMGVLLILGIHLVSHFMSVKRSAAATALAQKKSNHIIETVSLYETIKASALEDKRLSIWSRLTDNSAFAGHLERKLSNFNAQSAVVIAQVVIVFTLIIGVYELGAGLITVGGLAASSLLVGRAIAPMSALFGLILKAYRYRKTSATIEDIFNAPLELAGDLSKMDHAKIHGDIALSNMSFKYDVDDPYILEGLNIKIQKGEKVALIGKVGCGKSTLMRLMVRYYEANQGHVLVDGHDIRQYAPSNLRQEMVYMSQNYNLFDTTLQQNITAGIDGYDKELFAKIVQVTGVHNFASKHKDGYGMSVGVMGDRLSGGQKQSVTFAKTLLKQPQVYLLDEPTSAMDSSLENQIIQNLKPLIKDSTLIVATHRTPILNLVDRIIWLDQGKVKMDGPRDDVIRAIQQASKPANETAANAG